MNRFFYLMAALTFIAGAFISTAGIATANPTSEYKSVMTGLLPVVNDWVGEMQQTAHAAAVKPDPERIAELEDLGIRGTYILDDLRGTAALVPEPLQTAHWQMADAVGSMIAAANSAGDDPVGAAEMVDSQMDWSEASFNRINNFVTRFGIELPGDTPHVPAPAGD